MVLYQLMKDYSYIKKRNNEFSFLKGHITALQHTRGLFKDLLGHVFVEGIN